MDSAGVGIENRAGVFRISPLHLSHSLATTSVDEPVNRMILLVLSISTRCTITPAFTAPAEGFGEVALFEGLRAA